MFKQEIVIKQVLKNILSKDEQPQNTLRQWQLYRGLTIEILTELEHSGGMTTRDISTRINKTAKHSSTKLSQMLSDGLVEKVEKWGWRITRNGINCLLITNSNNNNNYVTERLQNVHRTTTEPPQHYHSTFPLENQEQKEEECIPGCFHQKFCHIKQICKIKEYNDKTSVLCEGCVWFKSETWTGSKDSKGNTG